MTIRWRYLTTLIPVILWLFNRSRQKPCAICQQRRPLIEQGFCVSCAADKVVLESVEEEAAGGMMQPWTIFADNESEGATFPIAIAPGPNGEPMIAFDSQEDGDQLDWKILGIG